MDALTLLTADHNRVRGLFARFKDAEDGDDADKMLELAAEIVAELEVHTTIEEDIFYPAVREVDDEVSDTVDEGLQEHHVAKVLIEELTTVEPGSDEWKAKVLVLIENVEHHAEEEEQEMFPPVRSKLDTDALDDLAQRLERRKVELGAPTIADKIDLTKDRLMELAREQEIPGRSKMSQDELAATVAPG